MEKTEQKKITNSDYEALISKSLENKSIREKTIVNGNVISFENDMRMAFWQPGTLLKRKSAKFRGPKTSVRWNPTRFMSGQR